MNQELTDVKALLEIEDAMTLSVLDTLMKKIHTHYPDRACKTFHEPNASVHAKIPMAGVNPILLTQVYRQVDHHCYVTYFLGPEIGYEMCFRIASTEEEVKQDFVNLLAQLTNQSLFHGKFFDQNAYMIHHMEDWFGSDIKAVLALTDPIFGENKLSFGIVRYIHFFGITQEEYDHLTNKGPDDNLDQGLAKTFIEKKLKDNPYLITKEG